jgi:hypothetical protein
MLKFIIHLLKWKIPKAYFYKVEQNNTTKALWIDWCNCINEIPANEHFFFEAVNGAKNAFNLVVHPEEYGNFQLNME